MKIVIVATLLACVFSAAAQDIDYRSGSVLSGTVPDDVTVRFLQDNFDVWRARSRVDGKGEVDIWVDAAQAQHLRALGFQLSRNDKLSATLSQLGPRNSAQTNGIANFPCYRTVEETYASVDRLVTNYPNLARTVDIGDSYLKSVGLGGYPLKALIIENSAVPPDVVGDSKPTLLLISAIHAREYATAEIAMRFAERLLAGYQSDAELRWLLDHRRIIIVPQMNPDGRKRAETGVSQRRNLRPATCATAGGTSGVDLNRNSSFKWGNAGGSSIDGCTETYRGSAAASEPEVQAIEQLIAQTFPDRRGPLDTDAAPFDTEGVFLSLHSYADMVLFPWGAITANAPNKTGLQSLARKFGFYNRYTVCQPPVAGCLYAASGTTDDQSYGQLGVASFTFEVGNNGFFESCSIFESSTVDKNISALLFALKAAKRPYTEPSGPEVTELTALTELIPGDGAITVSARASDLRSASGGQGNEMTHAIRGAVMYLNVAPGSAGANGIVMDAGDGNFDTPEERLVGSIPMSLLRPGRNTVFVQASDISTQSGVLSASFVRAASSFANGFE
jgi:carboxypeptidase T